MLLFVDCGRYCRFLHSLLAHYIHFLRTGHPPQDSGEGKNYHFDEYFVEAHAEEVEAETPDGMVQVQLEQDGEWITTTIEGARELHESMHED